MNVNSCNLALIWSVYIYILKYLYSFSFSFFVLFCFFFVFFLSPSLLQIDYPHLGKLCALVIPCGLTALDHWSPEVKVCTCMRKLTCNKLLCNVY